MHSKVQRKLKLLLFKLTRCLKNYNIYACVLVITNDMLSVT